nr:uncharacterized protein LOC111508340 [Leptinotarsa decemlineata]
MNSSLEIGEKIPEKVNHSDKKSLNMLTEMLNALTKQSKSTPRKNKKPSETHSKINGTTPIAKRLRKHKQKQDGLNYVKLEEFLKKKENEMTKPNKQFKPLDIEIQNIENVPKKCSADSKTKQKDKSMSSSMPIKKNSTKKKLKYISDSSTSQTSLDSYLNKTPNIQRKSSCNSKKTMNRTDSSDSCDLPTFKPMKKSKINKKDKESFIKYGVSIPTIDEILKDQKDLQNYKTQVESFKPMCDKSFELPFCVKNLNTSPVVDTLVLDCKGLSLKDVTKCFRSNVGYISDIFHGRVYNERHDRYNNINTKVFTLTTKDLSYNTSMIVFTFKQIEHMLSLLGKEFDTKDNKTHYFFQVLLPELCLKIFMDTHGMSREEAVLYLDERPVVGE